MRTIYSLYEKNCGKEGVRSKDIAEKLQLAKPNVSRTLKRLGEQKYISAGSYSKITLTKPGLAKAKKITYKHRIIETFLIKILNYDLNASKANSKSHEATKHHLEAHRLEHAFSDESIQRLDSLLGFPEKTPSGRPIPRGEF